MNEANARAALLSLRQKWQSMGKDFDALEIALTGTPTPTPKPGMIRGLGYTWVQGNENRPKLTTAELNKVVGVQIAFCSSFGGGAFLTELNGLIDWAAIEQSINRIRSAPVPVAILGMWPGVWTGASGTFAPRGPNGEAPGNERRPLEKHFPKAASFGGQFAAKYPEIKVLGINSENKGFWNNEKNTWDVDLSVRFSELVRTEVRKVNPNILIMGDYHVLKFADRYDNNESPVWRGNGWVGDHRTLESVIAYTDRFRPDVIGVDFAPVVASAGFEPFFKFVELLRAHGFTQPILSAETYMGGDPGLLARALKQAALDPFGICLSVWGEVGLGGILNNPTFDSDFVQKIKASA